MGKTILALTIATTLGILAGCSGNRELIKSMGTSRNQSVFQEIDENAPPAHGYADLRVYSSLKTHKPGIYSRNDIHGTQDYLLLLNIDGHALTLKGCMSEEGSEARAMGDPEEGDGIRYQFRKRLRVKGGVHRVFAALPADGLVAEGEVIIYEGENSSLTIEPVYGSVPGKQRPGRYGLTSFRDGIKSIRLLLNGKSI